MGHEVEDEDTFTFSYRKVFTALRGQEPLNHATHGHSGVPDAEQGHESDVEDDPNDFAHATHILADDFWAAKNIEEVRVEFVDTRFADAADLDLAGSASVDLLVIRIDVPEA